MGFYFEFEILFYIAFTFINKYIYTGIVFLNNLFVCVEKTL